MSLQLSISPTEQLSLSYDSHIPDRLWQAARRIERTHKAKQVIARNSRVRISHVTIKPDIAIALMADTIVKSVCARGCVDKRDFQQVGISQSQIDEYRDQAFTLAQVLEPRIGNMLATEG